MRRAVLASVPLVLLAAACADQPLGVPAPDAAPALGVGADAGAGVFLSEPRVLAYTVGGLRYGQNLPLPDIGGDLVVWQDAAGGDSDVWLLDLSTGAKTTLAGGPGSQKYPVTDGRYVVWSDERTDGSGGLYLHDTATGRTRRISETPGYLETFAVADGRVAFVADGNVFLYDIAAGETRRVTGYDAETGLRASTVSLDGGLLAWVAGEQRGPYDAYLVAMDLATGEVRELGRQQYGFGTPSASEGRITYAGDQGGSNDVYVYDWAARTERRISDQPRSESQPDLSGRLVVWVDTRSYTHPMAPANLDVYGFDLASGTEFAVATGLDLFQSWPRVSGERILWSEFRDGRWEIRMVEVVRPTLDLLRATVDGMLASGAIANDGIARALTAFLDQAAALRDAGDTAGARERLEHFASFVRRHEGKQIDPAAAQRLASMAAAVMRGL